MVKTKHTLSIVVLGVLFCVLCFYVSVFEGASPWVKFIFKKSLPDTNSHSIPKASQIALQYMVLIPAGEFIMGSNPKIGYDMCIKNVSDLPKNKDNPSCHENWYLREAPVHKVFLDAFYIDKYEVSQEKYEIASGENPSKFRGLSSPVENINWSEANQYCKSLGKRLPTEAEWEKAAKGGNDTIFTWGNKMQGGKANYMQGYFPPVPVIGWAMDGYKFTAPVDTYLPNGYGLFGMSGNVMEWVQDWAAQNYYSDSPKKNPKGPREGRKKILRGGSYHDLPVHIRVAWRDEYNPTGRDSSFGVRCALSAP